MVQQEVINRVYVHKCLRCGWEWGSRQENPAACARCKTRSWNVPKRNKKAEKG